VVLCRVQGEAALIVPECVNAIMSAISVTVDASAGSAADHTTQCALRNISSLVTVSASHASAVANQGVISTISGLMSSRMFSVEAQVEARKALVAITSTLGSASKPWGPSPTRDMGGAPTAAASALLSIALATTHSNTHPRNTQRGAPYAL
jgi:hypothetical protein